MGILIYDHFGQMNRMNQQKKKTLKSNVLKFKISRKKVIKILKMYLKLEIVLRDAHQIFFQSELIIVN